MKIKLNKQKISFKRQNTFLAISNILYLAGILLFYLEINEILEWTNWTITIFIFLLSPFIFSFFWFLVERKSVGKKMNTLARTNLSPDQIFKIKVDELSTKEREVLLLILDGKSNKEICNSLFIAKSTLKTHINHIYKKIDVRTRKELKSKLF